MSFRITPVCDFCGAFEEHAGPANPHGWVRMNLEQGPLEGTMHICPLCQTAATAKSMWVQIDRVLALAAGVPGVMPVPTVLIDDDVDFMVKGRTGTI